MKPSLLFVPLILLFSCSKEEGYGPRHLKNGQEVEVLVDHRYGSVNSTLLLLPGKQPAEMSLYAFDDREPGYNYRVKARMVVEKEPPEDGAAYYLNFLKVLSKEKYKGTEPFDLELIQAPVPSPPTIVLRKQDGHYYFLSDKIELTYQDEKVGNELEEIWQQAKYIRENWKTPGIQGELKWRSIVATVVHDPEKFGKAYRVEAIAFVNK